MSEKKDIRSFFGPAAKKKPVSEAAVPAKPSSASKPETPKKNTPKKSKRELSDEELVERVVNTAASKKSKEEPKKEEQKKEEPKKATPKKATPKKATPKKQPEAKKKALTLDSDDDKDIQPAKKVSKKNDEDDGVVVIVSDEEVPKKKANPPEKVTAAPPPPPVATKAVAPAKRKVESPAKSVAAKSPDAKKAKSEAATAVAAAPAKKKFDPRKFAERAPPPMLGLKPVPVGEENCLFGKIFVITGTLESLERDEAAKLIERYAGEVTKSVAKKCTHALVGTAPGESKLKKIEEQGLIVVDEDGLFELIRTGTAKKTTAKFAEKKAKLEKLETEGKEQPKEVVQSIRALQANEVSDVKEMWTTKYAPKDSSKLLANVGAISKVRNWLNRWKNPDVVKDKGFKRACLISGVPGIGKSTTAALLAKEAGFDVLEFNASDARSKKRLQQEGFMEISDNRNLGEFFKSESRPSQPRSSRTLVIMDEVDGMGAGDRGGNQELIALIKKTHVPVICICNDRQKASVKSLANYCEDVRFTRPNQVDIAGRMKVIMENEGFKFVDIKELQRLCQSVNNDIRQVLNLLQMLRVKTDRLDDSLGSFQSSMAEGRTVELNPFGLMPRFFSQRNTPSVASDLFFNDYDLMPLFIQENYLYSTTSHADPLRVLNSIADAADVISYGDLVKDQIMKSQDWVLLPFLSMVSTVIPCATVRGRLGKIEFPGWLGKNSTANRNKRILKEVQVHMSAFTSGTEKNEIRLDYIPSLLEPLVKPLEENGQEGIDTVMAIMDAYGLTKDDWETLFALSGKEERITSLDPKLKAAFTRKYNKTQKRVAVAPTAGGKRGKGGISRLGGEEEEFLDEEAKEYNQSEEEEVDEADDVAKDTMIKKKKKPAAKAASAKAAKPKAAAKKK